MFFQHGLPDITMLGDQKCKKYCREWRHWHGGTQAREVTQDGSLWVPGERALSSKEVQLLVS